MPGRIPRLVPEVLVIHSWCSSYLAFWLQVSQYLDDCIYNYTVQVLPVQPAIVTDIAALCFKCFRALGRHFCQGSRDPTIWISKVPKQNLKGPSIEIHYQFSNYGGSIWALRQNFKRVPLDFQGLWALTSGPTRALCVVHKCLSMAADADLWVLLLLDLYNSTTCLKL